MSRIILLLSILNYCYGDWFSDWMSPIQKQITHKNINLYNKEIGKVIISNDQSTYEYGPLYKPQEEMTNEIILEKLNDLITNAKQLANNVQKQINLIGSREKVLKEAIANGRYGVSTVKVSIENKIPRWYIIRDGSWNFCDGYLQEPLPKNRKYLFADNSDVPKCIGQEITTRRDNCAFNSIIQYETLPTYKKLEYEEDNYLCIKYNFNTTMEQYLSVPKKIINSTCQSGIVRSIEDNIKECGVRTLSEYTFYPYKFTSPTTLPFEYCMENDGVCKLLVGWNIMNETINNYEYLKDDINFKKYFMLNEISERIS